MRLRNRNDLRASSSAFPLSLAPPTIQWPALSPTTSLCMMPSSRSSMLPKRRSQPARKIKTSSGCILMLRSTLTVLHPMIGLSVGVRRRLILFLGIFHSLLTATPSSTRHRMTALLTSFLRVSLLLLGTSLRISFLLPATLLS